MFIQRYNATNKEALVALAKEFRGIFDYYNFMLSSTFGSIDKDNRFDENDSNLLELSKHLDLMHIPRKATIIGLIKMGVPLLKITIQQRLNLVPNHMKFSCL